MMGLTRKTEYAIRGMVYLSRKPEGHIAMLGDIAQVMKAPPAFLAKAFQNLAKSGLVRSVKGIRGGFALGRPPEMITLCEIVEAIEGPIVPNECLMGEGMCSFQKTCTVHPVWRRLQSVSRGILEEVTLKALSAAR
jgi:Rrf2 family transcriptional regulator, iron-sulfur cluster assembly transcription factor